MKFQVDHLIPKFESKILSNEKCIFLAKDIARPLVFTNGVFDILHRGHVTYLDHAAQFGATLIVGINTDSSVQLLNKGLCKRPLNKLEDRKALIAALSCVTYVTDFCEKTPETLIAKIQPEFLVKGGDYNVEKLPETALIQSWGGEVLAIPIKFKQSTSLLISKIKNL